MMHDKQLLHKDKGSRHGVVPIRGFIMGTDKFPILK
jgi:hypothetical protein